MDQLKLLKNQMLKRMKAKPIFKRITTHSLRSRESMQGWQSTSKILLSNIVLSEQTPISMERTASIPYTNEKEVAPMED